MGKSDDKKGYDTRLPFRHNLTISNVWNCGTVFCVSDEGHKYQFDTDKEALNTFLEEKLDWNETDCIIDLLNNLINKKDYGKITKEFFKCFSHFKEQEKHDTFSDECRAIRPFD